MFNELMKIIKTAEEANTAFLKKNYKSIEKTQDWRDILGIKGSPEDLGKLRQDNYIRPEYTMEQLQKMSRNAGRDLTAVYDTSGYLSKLMLTAYELDELFHDTLREVFQIDISTGRSRNGKLFYSAGPVKGLSFLP